MKGLLLIPLAAICMARVAFGQAASAGSSHDALPPGPLIVRKLPAFSQWTVDFKYKDNPKPGEISDHVREYQQLATVDPAVAAAMRDPHFVYNLDPARPLHLTVTKTGKMRNEEWIYERNLTGELWSDSKFTIQRKPDSAKLAVAMASPLGENEFPELDWISADVFKGIITRGDRKFLFFQKTVFFMAIEQPKLLSEVLPNAPKVSAKAYIDLETRYPVSVDYGGNQRIYTFLPTPKGMIVFPPAISAAVDEQKARIGAATKPLAKP